MTTIRCGWKPKPPHPLQGWVPAPCRRPAFAGCGCWHHAAPTQLAPAGSLRRTLDSGLRRNDGEGRKAPRPSRFRPRGRAVPCRGLHTPGKAGGGAGNRRCCNRQRHTRHPQEIPSASSGQALRRSAPQDDRRFFSRLHPSRIWSRLPLPQEDIAVDGYGADAPACGAADLEVGAPAKRLHGRRQRPNHPPHPP